MSFGKSALFLFFLILVMAPLSWFTAIFPYKSAKSLLNNIPNLVDSSLVQQFPEDLVISVKNGIVSLNRPSPYCLVLKPDRQIGILFNTESEPKIEDFESELCIPLVVVGSHYVMSRDNDQFRTQKISEQANFDINQKGIFEFTDKYLPQIIAFGRNIYLALPFVIIIPALLFFLLNNVWYSFISRMILKITRIRPDVKAGEVYSASLFFYTSINFIQWVVVGYLLNHTFKLNASFTFPFINTILIAIACVFYFKAKPSPPALPPPVSGTPASTPPIHFKTVTPPKT